MNDMPVFGSAQIDTKTALEDIAIETGTPIEVLFASGEQAGAKTPDEFLSIARQRGQQLGPRFKAGEDPTAIVTEVFGPEARNSFRDYAAEVRAQLYGTPTVQQRNQAALENEGFLDTAKRRGQQFVRGVTEPFAAMPEAAAIAQAQTDSADTPAADMEGFARGQQMRDSVADTFGAPNPEDRSFWGQVFEGAGNLVGMGGAALAAGAAGTAVAGPVGGTVAGLTTGAGIGSAMNASQLYREAREMGAEEGVAEQAARWGAAIGASEIVPIARAFKYLPQGVRQKIGNGMMKRFVDIAQSAGEEAAQEYLATVANNMVAQQLYDPDRGWTEGATEAALVGAVLGAGAGGIGAGVDAYRNRQQPQPLPEAGPDQGAAPPGVDPASGPVPPVAPSSAPQGEPTPTSDVLRPQPVDPLDPAGQRPAAPAPMSDALAGAPQPTLGGFQPDQPVQIQLVDPETGELSDPIAATFVGEDTAQGYASFRGPDGSPAEIDLADIASGNVIVSPVDAPVPMASETPTPVGEAIPPAPPPAQPQAAPIPSIPAGVDPDAFMERVAIREADGMSPDEAYQLTLQDTLDATREDDGAIPGNAEEQQRRERENQSRVEDAVFTDDRGQPVVFPTEDIALGRLGAGYTVEPFGGGFIGVRQQEAAGNERNANDSVGGDGDALPSGRNNPDGGGPDRGVLGEGRDNPALPPAEQGAAQGVADAAGAADADVALTGAQGQPGSWIIREKDGGAVVMETFDKKVVDALNTAKYEAVPAREHLAGLNADQNPVKKEATTNQVVTPDQPETAPVDQETDPIRAASQGVPSQVDYPNRKLNMRKARAEAPIDGIGDMDEGSFGSIALANAREGDVLPGVGTVSKVTDKQVQIAKPDGKVIRLSEGSDRFNKMARDMGALIAASANLRDEQLGSLMDMIERDPTLVYRDGVPMLFDDPAEQANRGQRAQRGGVLRQLAPTRQEVEQAAAETDPNPTEAQKEAENYKTGKVQWNGLTLSIENAKGSERSKKTPDGKTSWSVTMPAHYGRILRTEGADGDHVDFYMGDVPDSDYVLIINQVDPETQKMDEHKVIIGTTARGAALGIYRDGFSDGSGNSRIGSFTETNVENLKAWLASGETKTPTQAIDMPFAKRKAETKAPAPKPAAPKRLSPKKAQENRMAKLREYFTPGNIVQSYGGTDRVISFNEGDNGDWTVTVEAVTKKGDEWVKDAADTRVRTHSTNPDARRLAQGPIEKGMPRSNEKSTGTPEGEQGNMAPQPQRGNQQDNQGDSDIRSEPSKPTTASAKPVDDIEGVIRAANRAGHAPETAEIMPVQSWLVSAAQDVGLALGGFTHTLDGSAVRHILKEHGEANKEAKRGNVQITEADIESIPSIISAPDFVVFGSKSKQGKDQVAYLKKMDDGSTLYFEEVRSGRKRLAALTMRKYPATTSSDSILSALRLDARSDGGDAEKVILSSDQIKGLQASTNNDKKTPLWERAGPSNSSAEADPLNPKGQSDAKSIADVATDAKPTSILSSLSEEKQARAAELKKRLADKVRNQTSSGLDPEYITLGGELVSLYIEAGTKRFGQMLRDFAETTGLSMREAQAPMRAAYNYVRDEMDLDGQDVSDMDSADQVMAEIRKALAEAFIKGETGEGQQADGPFGPVITGYEGDWKGAALELERRQTGEAPAALSHPDIGPIALVWGKEGTSSSDGMGLAKLIAWHPEVLDDLQGRLAVAEVVSRTEGRIQLRSKRDNFGIRLQFDGDSKTWLLTAFERGRQRTERSSSRLSDIWDGSFSPPPLTQGDNSKTGDQDQGSAPEPATRQPAPEAKTKPTDKIEDFGEKIGGARKDVWGGFKDRMDAATALDIKAEPLSKSWPEPHYEKLIEAGVDAWTVGFVRAARESIPRKPSAYWKLKPWVASVETLRKFSIDLMNGDISVERVQEKLAESPVLARTVGNKIDLYLAVGHGKSLKDLQFRAASYSVKDGVYHSPSLVLWEVSKNRKATSFSNMPTVLTSASTKEEAIAKFKEVHKTLDDSGQKKGSRDKGAKFSIYKIRKDGGETYSIETKIGSNRIVLRNGITDVDEARRMVREEREQLQAQLDRMRDIPNERRDENAPRMGVDRRNGADITPEVFADTFGFRGVEFGNWVEQGRRQQDLNEAYDALMDMAAILDIPPKAVSLNGALGLAFGARGKGGKNPAAAHFEPGKMVINMTKRAGRGSLAHEWFHALDNYFSLKRKQARGQYITDNNSPAGPLTEGVRPETVEAFLAVKRAIANTKLKARSQEMDRTRTTPYWGTGIEMHARAFESYMLAKLADQNASNDYLVNVVDNAVWDVMASMQGLGDSYPYLKPDEIEGVRAAFDNLFRIMERRETDRGVAMEMRSDANGPVATLTGQELGDWSDMRDLRRKAEAWYRDNLVGTTVKNDETGITIEFDNTGASKTAGRKGDILYRSVVALPQILKSGKLVASEPDRRGRKQIKAVHKFRADVQLDGEVYSLIATVRERTDGTFHYDLSKAADLGAKQPLDAGSEASASLRAGDESRFSSALEGDPVGLNLELASPEVNTDPAFTEDARRAITKSLQAEVAKVLPGKRVSVSLVRELYSLKDGKAIMGRANRDGTVQVSEAFARDSAGAAGILNHEIVHVLRDKGLWRSDYGLFERGEWERLVRKAEADAGIVASVNERYKGKGLTREEMQEEYVAEMYRLWKGAVDGYGAVERILLKIEDFFRALASAFRGEGFDSAGRIMQRIADGRIGGRDPSGPGRGARAGADGMVPAEMRDQLNAWSQQVFDALTGKIAPEKTLTLGPVPEIIRVMGGRGNSLVMAASKLQKIRKDHPEVTPQALAKLPSLLADPVFVLDNQADSRSGDRLFVTDMVLGDDTVLVASIKRSGKDDADRKATVLITAYGKDQFTKMMRDAGARGAILYVRGEREGSGYKHTGANSLNAPLRGTMSTLRADMKILTPSRVFKSGRPSPEMRLGRDRDPVVNPSVMASVAKLWSPKPATSTTALDKKERNFVSNLLTNAMAMNDTMNTLGLVPGEVLFRDLGKSLPSAGKWVASMRQMTSDRNEMNAEADVLLREWLGAYTKDKVSGRKLHDLMHESTIEQVDPSERFKTPRRPVDMSDAQYTNFVENKRAKHAELQQRFKALPESLQDIYRKARDAYSQFDAKLIDAMVDSVAKAMELQADRFKSRYEGELQQFRDDGLEGAELELAKRKARSRYNQDIKMLEYSRNARVRKMRLTYESSRLEGPYFPLMRFGQFFVAARDDKGKLVHFERTSTAGAQRRIANEMTDAGFVVEKGVMKSEDNVSRFVDPNFVADITEALGEVSADSQILDAIYQRYLETLPSFSIRKANIHRQGTPGFDKDAIKAFGNRMFHGAHQLARLRHGMDMTKHIENARREAKIAADPVRAGALANEMQKRHEWAMNPGGAAWSAWASSANFVWYLGLTPSAAIMNLSQTTVVGIPVLTAGIEGATVAKTSRALLRALKDFTAGLKKGDAEWSRGALTSGNLTADERRALEAAYNSGALDKSQAHDVNAIGESGVEYSPIREKVMRPIAFLFHHAERLNREVTFLAAYRMLKDTGMDHDAAINKAGNLTWDTHFNYDNWSRPRFMQGDVARVIFTFRQFQVNMLYRLFRDSHQALKGESPEVRKQARAQLIGITASMMLHAGITGTWGYALIMLLAGMFFEGGSDEAEEELKNAIVSTFGPGAGGLLLKGVPGQLTGADLSSRMGMPELWFRSPSRQLEGADAHTYWLEQLLGPTAGISKSLYRGVELLNDGEVWRGMELMVPKAIRDQLRFVRYLNEGVTTYKGDPLLDDVSAHDAIVQAIGFSPARVSERYEQNRRLMNAQMRIEDERRKILSDITRYIRDGQEISPRALRRRDEFNAKYPTYAITGETVRRSYKARMRMSEQMDGGIRLNPKLERQLREGMAPSINN